MKAICDRLNDASFLAGCIPPSLVPTTFAPEAYGYIRTNCPPLEDCFLLVRRTRGSPVEGGMLIMFRVIMILAERDDDVRAELEHALPCFGDRAWVERQCRDIALKKRAYHRKAEDLFAGLMPVFASMIAAIEQHEQALGRATAEGMYIVTTFFSKALKHQGS